MWCILAFAGSLVLREWRSVVVVGCAGRHVCCAYAYGYMSMSKSNIPVSSSTVPIDAKEEYVYCCSALGRAAVVAVVAATA